MTFLHIGDHSGISLNALGLHLLEADHLFFMALTLAVGWGAYRHGRKVEARQQAAKERRS
jgi:EamA domain-containing membrane protein RarD